MIVGVGTDVVEIGRVALALERWGDRFVERILTPEERARYAGTRQKASHLAKRFAAKEAFGKALGTGIRPPAVLPSIAVAHDGLGKPLLVFHGRLAEMIENQHLIAHLSLSDEAEYAIAYVILEPT